MKIYKETALHNFEFWGGASEKVSYLTQSELDEIESILEVVNPDGIDETELNDMFWFNFDYVCNLIGLTEAEVLAR